MLVTKGMLLGRPDGDCLIPLECILADEEYFCVCGQVLVDEKENIAEPDVTYDVSVYPNDGRKTLKELGLIITE